MKKTPEERRVSSLLTCTILNIEHAASCARDGNPKVDFFEAEAARGLAELRAMSEASPKSILTVSEISKLLHAAARLTNQ